MCHLINTYEVWCKIWYILNIGKITMLKIYSTLSFGYDCGVISNVDGNGFSSLQIWEGVSFSHHVVGTSRIYQDFFRLRSDFHESMTSFMLWLPILLISPSKYLWNIDVIFIKKRSSFIKFLFMQACSWWKPFPQYDHLNFSFVWCPFPLFFFESEDSSCCWFSTLGLGALNFVFGFFYWFLYPLDIWAPRHGGLDHRRIWWSPSGQAYYVHLLGTQSRPRV